MASISVTNTFANGTTADASEVNTNFSDIINGTSDGTKDLSVAALTCASTVTFNGNVTLGNATSDTVTFTGRVASDILPSTDGARDLGSAALAWAEVHTDLIVAQSASISVSGLMDTSAQAFVGLKDFTEGVDVASVADSFYEADLNQTLSAITWVGSAAPTSLSSNTFSWVRIGNQVTLSYRIEYSGAGTANTGVNFPLPAAAPTPVATTGAGSSENTGYVGMGHIAEAVSSQREGGAITIYNTGSGFTVYTIVDTARNAVIAEGCITYFTAY